MCFTNIKLFSLLLFYIKWFNIGISLFVFCTDPHTVHEIFFRDINKIESDNIHILCDSPAFCGMISLVLVDRVP